MRPTFSIIVFTVLAGAGYGLWFLLGLGMMFWWPRCDLTSSGTATIRMCVYPDVMNQALIAGFVLVAIGLLSSVAHLGRPSRAWRALSQWRSSWLSREGIASLITFVPAVLAAVSLNLGRWHVEMRTQPGALDAVLDPSRALKPLGALLAIGALITVYCTANIYASLKTIRAWQNRFVAASYLVLALYSGALALSAVATLPYAWFAREMPFLQAVIIVLAILCATLKALYWRDIDALPPIDAGDATGLRALGVVRAFEQPHTEENYLTHEMGFVLARKHAAKLRAITLATAFALPAMLALVALIWPALQPLSWLALALGFGGLFVERWLFFAQARHAAMAYYGPLISQTRA